jgi:hypothetical protein
MAGATLEGSLTMSILTEFYRHNLWANLRLIDALEALPREVADAADRDLRPIRTTLEHSSAEPVRHAAAEAPSGPRAAAHCC